MMSKSKRKRSSKKTNNTRTVKKEVPNNTTRIEKEEKPNHTAGTIKKEAPNRVTRIVHNNWTCCIYMVLAILTTLVLFGPVKNAILSYMSTSEANGIRLGSNGFTVDSVYEPFAGTISLIIAVILAELILIVYLRILKRLGYELNNIERWLLFVELAATVLTAISVIYYSSDYKLFGLGIDAEQVRNGNEVYAPLKQIVALYNVSSIEGDSMVRTMLKGLAAHNMHIVENIDLWLAIVGATFVPLKIYNAFKKEA